MGYHSSCRRTPAALICSPSSIKTTVSGKRLVICLLSNAQLPQFSWSWGTMWIASSAASAMKSHMVNSIANVDRKRISPFLCTHGKPARLNWTFGPKTGNHPVLSVTAGESARSTGSTHSGTLLTGSRGPRTRKSTQRCVTETAGDA